MENLSSAIESKSQSLANKINKISAAFDIADEITSDDTLEYIEEKMDIIKSPDSKIEMSDKDIMVLDKMKDDFIFGRETLESNVKNARMVLDKLTLELLDTDIEANPELITSFSELNKGIADNLKVYFNSWKMLSEILINLTKVKDGPSEKVQNQVNVITTEPISTVDLIEALRNK